MSISEVLNEAFSLPTAAYRTPKQERITPSEAVCVGVGAHAMSNANSTIPVIATKALGPCNALILYNRKTKTGIIEHGVDVSARQFSRLLDMVRQNNDDMVDVHVVGAHFDDSDPEFAAENNESTISSMQRLVEAVTNTPHCTLATFDVYDKPKPDDVALDTRTGNLLRGTVLCSTQAQADSLHNHVADTSGMLFEKWRALEPSQKFDGTAPDLQRGKQR